MIMRHYSLEMARITYALVVADWVKLTARKRKPYVTPLQAVLKTVLTSATNSSIYVDTKKSFKCPAIHSLRQLEKSSRRGILRQKVLKRRFRQRPIVILRSGFGKLLGFSFRSR